MKPLKISFAFADHELLRRFFKDILTGKDGDSFDLGRVLGAFGFLGYMVLGTLQMAMIIYGYIWSDKPDFHEFPFLSFATGFGAIAAGAGSMIWMKKETEPDKPAPPPVAP